MAKVIATHDGAFHTDDVFAVAALLLALKGKAEIVRTRSPECIASADFAVDVGDCSDAARGRFDHHQRGGAGSRAGVSYASFGLVWKHFGETLAGDKEAASLIERRLALPIDAFDNGEGESQELLPDVFPYTVNELIDALNPAPDEIKKDGKERTDAAFLKAAAVAKELLGREIRWAAFRREAEKILQQSFASAEDKRIIVVDAPVPVEEHFSSYPEPLFVVYPYSDGTWAARSVRETPQGFRSRRLFPEDWAGKRESELQAVTGVTDAVFCHNKRFLTIAKTKEGAVKLAQSAVGSQPSR